MTQSIFISHTGRDALIADAPSAADELQTIEQGLQRISGHVDDGAARVVPIVGWLRR